MLRTLTSVIYRFAFTQLKKKKKNELLKRQEKKSIECEKHNTYCLMVTFILFVIKKLCSVKNKLLYLNKFFLIIGFSFTFHLLYSFTFNLMSLKRIFCYDCVI